MGCTHGYANSTPSGSYYPYFHEDAPPTTHPGNHPRSHTQGILPLNQSLIPHYPTSLSLPHYPTSLSLPHYPTCNHSPPAIVSPKTINQQKTPIHPLSVTRNPFLRIQANTRGKHPEKQVKTRRKIKIPG